MGGEKRKIDELAADDEAAAETSAEFKTDLNVAATTATDVAAERDRGDSGQSEGRCHHDAAKAPGIYAKVY